MDKTEASDILERRIDELRRQSFSTLMAERIGRPDREQVTGATGAGYQVEIDVVWVDRAGGDIRVVVSVDDGGWRALAPL